MSDKATPLRKLAPAPTQVVWTSTTEAPCRDKDHEPDKRGLDPGRYEWTCPTCGKVTVFDVQGPGVFL